MKKNKIIYVAGVDEAGRGPLAGPVYAAAVILDPKKPIKGLNDSKLISEKKRNSLDEMIRDKALAYSVAFATVREIEEINILQASLLAMKRAVESLNIQPHSILVDGTHCPQVNCEAEAIIKGDQTVAAISAASILAKVARDQVMVEFDVIYPGYGFAQHKGYGTEQHLLLLKKLGPCEIHRRTFAPVRESSTKNTKGDYQ